MGLVWESCKGERKHSSVWTCPTQLLGKTWCHEKPLALPMLAWTEALSYFGHRKYSVVSETRVPSPVAACLDIEKSLVCFAFFALVESWICMLRIPFLCFNFVNSVMACSSHLLQLQAFRIGGDLALVCTSCFTSLIRLWCRRLALISLQLPILLRVFHKCSFFTSAWFWVYQLYVCTNKMNRIMSVLSDP